MKILHGLFFQLYQFGKHIEVGNIVAEGFASFCVAVLTFFNLATAIQLTINLNETQIACLYTLLLVWLIIVNIYFLRKDMYINIITKCDKIKKNKTRTVLTLVYVFTTFYLWVIICIPR